MARKPEPAETPEDAQPEALEAQFAQLRADMARIAESLTVLAQSQGAAFAAHLGKNAESLRDAAAKPLAALQAGAEPKLDEARTYVRANPLQALGLAAGAGLIFGLLFGRR